MAHTNPTFTSFTISQPFLGAPLQFSPALGSHELEKLVDTYVIGSACKQDKLAQVTIDFYNNATVDLNTGALTKTYNVFTAPWLTPSFETSPAQSFSSSFSPSFTQSPASALGDSGYGSLSMTPPSRTGRVTKKARKDTQKVAEMRLPGFSIMTKDGIDVTNTAGRGTKTKEQREHAHLMRQLKACESCKRKKVKCDPSHRMVSADMSRTSTSTTKTSSSRQNPSPVCSTPSLSRANTQGSPPSFSPSNGIDDFVLFPEDNLSWNPADMSFSELETQDLGEFNFDLNDIDFSIPMSTDTSFDFSSFQQPASNFPLDNQLSNTPLLSDGYTQLEQWDLSQQPGISHDRPRLSESSQESGQLEPIFQSNWLGDSVSQWAAGGSGGRLQVSKNSSENNSPLQSFSSDWSVIGSGTIATASPQSQGESSSSALTSQSVDRKRRRSAELAGIENGLFQHMNAASLTATGPANAALDGDSGILVDPSDPPAGLNPRSQFIKAPSRSPSSGTSISQGSSRINLGSSSIKQGPSPTKPLSEYIHGLCHTCQLVSDSLESTSSPSIEHSSLGVELQGLKFMLGQLESGQCLAPDSIVSQIRSLTTQLSVLSVRIRMRNSERRHYNKLEPELRPEHFRQCQVQARRLVRSLCATINSTQAHSSGTGSPTGNVQILTSGSTLQIFVKSSPLNTSSSQDSRHPQTANPDDPEYIDSHSKGDQVDVTAETSTFDISRLEVFYVDSQTERQSHLGNTRIPSAQLSSANPKARAVDPMQGPTYNSLVANPTALLSDQIGDGYSLQAMSTATSSSRASSSSSSNGRPLLFANPAMATTGVQPQGCAANGDRSYRHDLSIRSTVAQNNVASYTTDSEHISQPATSPVFDLSSSYIVMCLAALLIVVSISVCVINSIEYSTHSINNFRQILTQWTRAASLISFARLLLCATVIAKLSTCLKAALQAADQLPILLSKAVFLNFGASSGYPSPEELSANKKLSQNINITGNISSRILGLVTEFSPQVSIM